MQWVVLDFGEVIARRTTAVPALAALVGAPEEAFSAAYWELRDPYDRGCPDLDYWRAVGDQAGVRVSERQAVALTEADILGWLDLDPATLALLGDLDRAGVALSMLSNAPVAHGRAFRDQPWAAHFQHVVISGDLGCAKPDPQIWQLLTRQLAARPADCLFLDDKQSNVDGALAAGLSAQRWTGAGPARRYLTDAGLL